MSFTIKWKINFLTWISVVLTILGVTLASYDGQRRVIADLDKKTLGTYSDFFWGSLRYDGLALEKLLMVFISDPNLVGAMQSGSQDRMFQYATPIFKKLKEQHKITHFYFINPDGKILLRVHNRAKSGDVIKRATFLQAKENGRMGRGIEMGAQFFSLRVVMPVQDAQGQRVGYLELGQELDHLIPMIKAMAQVDISLWVSAPYAEEKKITKAFEKTNEWYRVMASNEAQHKAILEHFSIPANLREPYYQLIETGSVPQGIIATPFKDAFGNQAGILLVSQNHEQYDMMLRTFLGSVALVSVIILLMVAGLGSLFAQAIVKPLRHMGEMLGIIATGGGDLTKRLPVHGRDETTELARRFNQFMATLQRILTEITQANQDVAKDVQTLTTLSTETHQTTQQQLDQTLTSVNVVEKMDALTHTVASRIKAASEATIQAAKEASSGRETVATTVSAIEKLADEVNQAALIISHLKKHSGEIGGMLNVIKEITEQTNLLALNAAIEAARAGDQGRGFAVVAGEVRVLAKRTQQSTEEIHLTISTLQNSTNQAVQAMSRSCQSAYEVVEIAKYADESLKIINNTVQHINSLNREVSSISQEQAATAQKVLGYINSIQTLARTTSEQSLQTKQSIEHLESLETNLYQVICKFKT